jgi:hypothetical protein
VCSGKQLANAGPVPIGEQGVVLVRLVAQLADLLQLLVGPHLVGEQVGDEGDEVFLLKIKGKIWTKKYLF